MAEKTMSNDRIRNQVIHSLSSGPKTFWEIFNRQDGTLKELYLTLNKLMKNNIIKREGEKFYLNDRIQIKSYPDPRCEHCRGGVQIKGEYEKILQIYKSIVKNRPLPSVEYDQGFISSEDAVRRAIFMYERGDIENKAIFILGDDDLVSIAIGLLGVAQKITVLEIDKRLIDFINDVSKEYNLNIKTINHDVIDSFPKKEMNKYDTFLTDPVETLQGFILFIYRCMQALKKKNSAGYFGLTHIEANLEKWHHIQKFILSTGMVITDIIRDFSYYPEDENQWIENYNHYLINKKLKIGIPNTNWFRSSFFRVEAYDKIKLKKLPRLKSTHELYVDDEAWCTVEHNSWK
ncbi:MAG: bis-aminopropyl spermidine synthase family protein [Candidatus Kryptonium sp.]|nr:bis-aminopropyl spermidine synthase family protein [Candidatus Kryptonium sp.]MCX7761907.1 bis-aminopropyl spermidine synthase family protein [Candidatus Kryptonium sp.]